MNPSAHTPGQLMEDRASGLFYRIRQPVPSNPVRCLFLLHGVGGNETNLLDLAEGVDSDTLVIFPRGPLQLDSQQFAWFRVTFTASGPRIVPEEAERSRHALIRLVENIQAAKAIAPINTVIAGFSQGGILSASVGLTSPERVAGFGVLSGRILPELEPLLASRERLAAIRAFVGHGEFDSTLPVDWAYRSDRWLSELNVDHLLRLYPVGHAVSAQMHGDFLQWMRTLT